METHNWGENGMEGGFRARESSVHERHVLELAHQKAEAIFRHEIDMKSFSSPLGNYDAAMVTRDMEVVADLKHKFALQEEENLAIADVKRISDVFEAMLADQIKNNNWFGGNAELIASSEYDDYVNHIDGVLHFKVPGSSDYIALGADVTFSRASIEEKIRHIKKRIVDGRLARVKYFELPDKSFKGELNEVPYIILGADAHSVLQMAEQWTDEAGGKYLGKHWMQAQLIDMAIMQCDEFSKFAGARGNTSASEKYGYMREKLARIKNMRQKITGPLPDDRDSMFRTMQEVLGVE
jgi:hypothetical protein